MKPRPIITAHQIARRMKWARLWLEGLARLLPAQGWGAFNWMAPVLGQRLKEMSTCVLGIILLRARMRLIKFDRGHRVFKLGHDTSGSGCRLAKFGHSQHIFILGYDALEACLSPSATQRVVCGTHLRRVLRGKTPRAQIEALLKILRDPEAEIARLARRLRRIMRLGVKFVFLLEAALLALFVADDIAAPDT